MRFDLGSLPSSHWSGGATKLIQLAQLTEKIGADRFSVADFEYFHDCLTLMTACSMATKRLVVESLVIDPFVRHPSLTACAMATIADLSGGRVVLGMGGREQPSYWGEDRIKPLTALQEAVEVIRRMWRRDCRLRWRGGQVPRSEAKVPAQVQDSDPDSRKGAEGGRTIGRDSGHCPSRVPVQRPRALPRQSGAREEGR